MPDGESEANPASLDVTRPLQEKERSSTETDRGSPPVREDESGDAAWSRPDARLNTGTRDYAAPTPLGGKNARRPESGHPAAAAHRGLPERCGLRESAGAVRPGSPRVGPLLVPEGNKRPEAQPTGAARLVRPSVRALRPRGVAPKWFRKLKEADHSPVLTPHAVRGGFTGNPHARQIVGNAYRKFDSIFPNASSPRRERRNWQRPLHFLPFYVKANRLPPMSTQIQRRHPGTC